MPTVVIDPGHGGTTAADGSSPNNVVGANGLAEKDVTLDLARRISALVSEHATVVLTRTGDENRSLADRAKVARDANADLFVSLHLNGRRDPAVDGTEAWVANRSAAGSDALARAVLDRVVAVTHQPDRGIQHADLGVLLPERLGPRTAATLVELAFLTNPDEAAQLARDDYKQSLAQAVASALTDRLTANGAVAQSLATTDQTDAIAIVNAFRAETTAGSFTPRRDDVADRAIALINDPTLVQQGGLGLCGPAAVHRLWIKRDPKAFARYLTALYDNGTGTIGSESISPGSDLRNQDYYNRAVPAMRALASDPANATQFVCPSADWVAMSSLRDAANLVLDFEGMPDEDTAAGTSSSEVAGWLRETGVYNTVVDQGNWFLTKGLAHAEALRPGTYTDVVLLINAHILTSAAVSGKTVSDEFIGHLFPNHFVVLESAITEPTTDEVEFDCWTWGELVHVRLRKDVFEPNYYGAVVATLSVPATASALSAPPARIDGIDCNAPDALPTWAELQSDGIRFVIHKATEHDTYKDGEYRNRHDDATAAHMLVGAYHFYRANADSTAQADNFIDVVERLLPGDLPPSFDFEEGGTGADGLGASGITGNGWNLPIGQFLDRVETALGRTPMIYTSKVVWTDFVKDDQNMAWIADYPLWVKFWMLPESSRYGDRLTRNQPPLPSPWWDWAIWQYSGDWTPSEYTHLFAVNQKMDTNVSNGGIHVLRGLAGLGRPGAAVHVGGQVSLIFSADENGTITMWRQTPTTLGGQTPAGASPAAGDVAGLGLGLSPYCAWRGRDDGHLYELGDGDGAVDLTATVVNAGSGQDPYYLRPAGDPVYLAVDLGNRALAYRGHSDHQYLLQTQDGTWHLPALDVTANAGLEPASGDPALYLADGSVHVVARAGLDGHLWDAWQTGTTWNKLDLTARSGAPAATYQPTTYAGSDGVTKVVFRALRGEIHQIDTHSSQDDNLSRLAGGAPTCAGSPAAFAIDSAAHVVYRGLDGSLHELYEDGGSWRKRDLATASPAAADPSVAVDAGPTVPAAGFVPSAVVSYRDQSGAILSLFFKSGTWTSF